jgi:hypothetical protein
LNRDELISVFRKWFSATAPLWVSIVTETVSASFNCHISALSLSAVELSGLLEVGSESTIFSVVSLAQAAQFSTAALTGEDAVKFSFGISLVMSTGEKVRFLSYGQLSGEIN